MALFRQCPLHLLPGGLWVKMASVPPPEGEFRGHGLVLHQRCVQGDLRKETETMRIQGMHQEAAESDTPNRSAGVSDMRESSKGNGGLDGVTVGVYPGCAIGAAARRTETVDDRERLKRRESRRQESTETPAVRFLGQEKLELSRTPESETEAAEDAALNDISLEYSYNELYTATAGFSVVLGQGAYGSVYEGVMRDGGAVAVKWLHKPKEAGFEKEVRVLSKFRHPNLVILMGFARHGTDRFLVYELLTGGDVGARLQKGPVLTWQERLSVALDAASALSHLHHHSPHVYHRDIKTANILLDRHNNAKVADFGLACLAKKGEDGCPVKQTAGTVGYADPKYISSAVVTERTEVYSFGMVLLELLTARPPAVLNADGSISYLLSLIGTSVKRALRYVDQRARFPGRVAQSFALLALRCVVHSISC
ncbi:tyrosine kinase-like protein [Cystoisospora suis]|uniref:Tyrosine kinase-like protein n=1 Tax=Cystoisospora suis TaxID=483139 RepID=A0A2C6KEE2_9APIC|nr:tyrosine kinase-like protein [Cystoisospora suis]